VCERECVRAYIEIKTICMYSYLYTNNSDGLLMFKMMSFFPSKNPSKYILQRGVTGQVSFANETFNQI